VVPDKEDCNTDTKKCKRFGLPEIERLKGKQVIKNIFRNGRRSRSGNLVIIYLLSEKPQAGFVASKKIGGAVKRNRVKRLLREAYRMNKEIFQGLKVIFYAVGPLTHKEILWAFKKFRERG